MSQAIMTVNTSISLLAPGNSLESYLQKIRQIPVLSAEEENTLALRFRDHNDLAAARQLVMSNLRFVAHIARGYNGYGLPLADLIQEGGVGLMKAVKRFKPEIGVRLVSFAVHWIRAEIHEHILRNWRIVKIATTKAQRKLFFNLRSSKKRISWLNREEAETVAEDLGVTTANVLEMEQRLSSPDVSFDLPVADDDESSWAPAAYLTDASNQDPARLVEQDDTIMHSNLALANALSTLDERSQVILEKRWLAEKKTTLHQLADQFGISAERVRQLEKNALGKLQQLIA
ncbi:MAG: RNA polymerase sigma factor RpoH [Gammaproteobacteria bacterium]